MEHGDKPKDSEAKESSHSGVHTKFTGRGMGSFSGVKREPKISTQYNLRKTARGPEALTHTIENLSPIETKILKLLLKNFRNRPFFSTKNLGGFTQHTITEALKTLLKEGFVSQLEDNSVIVTEKSLTTNLENEQLT